MEIQYRRRKEINKEDARSKMAGYVVIKQTLVIQLIFNIYIYYYIIYIFIYTVYIVQISYDSGEA